MRCSPTRPAADDQNRQQQGCQQNECFWQPDQDTSSCTANLNLAKKVRRCLYFVNLWRTEQELIHAALCVWHTPLSLDQRGFGCLVGAERGRTMVSSARVGCELDFVAETPDNASGYAQAQAGSFGRAVIGRR
jgi:hypothetical protein